MVKYLNEMSVVIKVSLDQLIACKCLLIFYHLGDIVGKWLLNSAVGRKRSNLYNTWWHIIQMCSGITCGRVLNGELYAQRFQKLIYLHLFTDCFMKISPLSPAIWSIDWGERSWNSLKLNADKLTSEIFVQSMMSATPQDAFKRYSNWNELNIVHSGPHRLPLHVLALSSLFNWAL